MIHLLWAVHNHQPVGNFDFVFERAFDRAYRPFLEVIQRHPGVRVSIHFTGILLDWLEANHPEYLKRVRALVKQGRVEVLGGGYYEPILPMLTEADRVGQVTKLSARVEELFGRRPRGMWLAERVWEPSLVSSIADGGIEYVVLDGSHFKMVGKTDEDLDGYFETEDQGRSLKLLPIHDVVRDYIPFRQVEDVVHALRELDRKAGGGRVQVVFGDDGEKFGDWPETYETVYTHGWLDRFFSALEAEPEHFAVRPLHEGIDHGHSLGLVYLPPASYGEMMVWAQNPENIPRYRSTREALQHQGRGEDAERFLRGTFWRNFLVKYPESNRLHKQALRLSLMLAASRLPALAMRNAREHVWQAQCNCAYWHGVFGGLYLPHLRFALYRHLIDAQKTLDAGALKEVPHTFEAVDWNFDGRDEYLLNTRALLLGFTAGGAVDQQWHKRTGVNLCDTLTRRREAYHDRIGGRHHDGTKLEDQISAKEEGLEDYLIYDRRVRETFAERLLPPGTSRETYRLQHAPDGPELVFGAPKFKARKNGLQVVFSAAAPLPEGELELVKTYLVSSDGRRIDVEWAFTWHGRGEAAFRFAAETLFCLLAGNAHDRYLLWEENGEARRDILASRGAMPGDTDVALVDEWLRFRAVVSASGNAETWRDAIETVSQSEGGYERVYQGTVVAPVWDARLAHGETAVFGLRVEFEESEGES
jgi:alpha-amylase